MLRAAALFVGIPLAAFGQQEAIVQGRVSNSITHAGVSGAAVTIWTQQAVHYNTTTDETGGWRITGVKPGRYFSRFEKSGFIEPPSENPFTQTALAVGAGGPPVQLDGELVPLATVRGRVLDPEGKPAPGIAVECGAFANVKTDPDGQFVIPEVRPGSYTLLAKPKPAPGASPGDHRTEAVPTFYPSEIERAQAAKIAVRGGDDLPGFEIRLRTSPVYRVRGTVLDESGKPVANADVQLFSRSSDKTMAGQMSIGSSMRFYFGPSSTETRDASATTHADGAFEFPSVRPGQWYIRAETEPRRDSARNLSIVRSAPVEATVADHDLDDLRLRLAETFTLLVTLDWGDRPPPKLDPRAGTSLLLIPADGEGPTLPRMPVRNGDELRYENVTSGRYRVVPMAGFPAGYYPASVLLEGRDVLGQPVELNSATPPLRIVYKPNAGTVRGAVEKGEGATVLLWPQSAAIDLLRAVQAGPNGTFEFGTVAPGDYYILAVDRQNLERQPESVLRGFQASATPVRVDEAASPSVSLGLTHLSE